LTEPSARSFRDRHSGVRFEGDRVVRSFDREGADWFLAAHDAGLLRDLLHEGLIVDYTIVSEEPLTIHAPRLPLATYPYEWTPTMIKDAATSTLDVALRAWDAGFHLRDASAFNMVFHEGRPVLVDLGSFRPGHTSFFLAYGQFCDHFLNPLAVAETVGISPRSVWASLEGLSADQARRMMGAKALRPRYVRHIWARARLERSSESLDAAERRGVRTGLGLPPEAIRKAIDKLRATVEAIGVSAEGTWGSYEQACSYEQEQTDIKGDFVRRVASKHPGAVALDIGANAGHYSGILAPHFRTVVAIEPDEEAADALYERVKTGTLPANIVPMVVDVADPSGGRGFENRERPAAMDRIGGADLVVWLAVIHHLVLGRNIPLPMVFEMALRLADWHVFEFVDPEDDMSRLLLAARDESPWPMDRSTFEREMQERFNIIDEVEVTPTRRLYEVVAS